MKKILIPLSISILIIGLIGWLMVSGSSSDNPGDTGSNEVAQQAVEETKEEAAAAEKKAAAEDAAVEAAAADEGEGAVLVSGPKLHGGVSDLEGNPIPGARVMLRISSSWEGMEDADRYTMFRQRVLGKESVPVRGPASHRTQADGSGKYAFALSAIKKGRYDILASAEGFAPGDQRWKWTKDTSRVDFQLGIGEIIRGIVRSPDGVPVEGAVVLASKSDGRGWGRFGPGGGRGGAVDETTSDSGGLFTLNVYAGEFDL
ncbi:MAG: carboxypeptidase-like regulatory domain-containing protein, partial [Planctomycetes bacterium]|nr:carboxypeptidase-like regulatory domain-containing protein [Planctomycetota bacterium]